VSFCCETIPVHVTDGKMARRRILARCHAHPPTEAGWSQWPIGRSHSSDICGPLYLRVEGLEFPIDEAVCPNEFEIGDEVPYEPSKAKRRHGENERRSLG
jgi:hypothetical protein